ncbi:hypothetical protein [Agromyces larvae]|uniref:Uncharacterized protein n=1 Tax=Agromyces larvae TaxID=2929802 RepID=A0ABY4C0F4_9MICO|nr:hypothetical protein [Agromyces larvae]UOE44489.1 hypothetical protein MTO99_01465 [Agromyces larvae]
MHLRMPARDLDGGIRARIVEHDDRIGETSQMIERVREQELLVPNSDHRHDPRPCRYPVKPAANDSVGRRQVAQDDVTEEGQAFSNRRRGPRQPGRAPGCGQEVPADGPDVESPDAGAHCASGLSEFLYAVIVE